MNIFVIITFDSHFDLYYRDLLKKPLEKRNHTVKRADDVSSHQSILKTVIQNISDANLIIADLTTQNPNVYYELGIAHALGKPTIQIVQDLDEVPFDLRAHYIISYSLRYDEAEKLHNEILEKIDREEGNEYIFSNPVREALDSRSRIIVTTPTSRNSDESEESPSDDVELEDDHGEMGTLDAIVEAEESANIIVEVAEELTEEIEKLGERASIHTQSLNDLNVNPNQKGINSKRLQIARKYATDINTYCAIINSALPKFNLSWTKLDQGLGHYLSGQNIKKASELEQIESLAKSIASTQDGLNDNILTYENLREVLKGQLGLSKVTDRALTNMERSLGKLIDELEIGHSTLTRMIDLARDMIDRYNASNSNDGDNDDHKEEKRSD